MKHPRPHLRCDSALTEGVREGFSEATGKATLANMEPAPPFQERPGFNYSMGQAPHNISFPISTQKSIYTLPDTAPG